jgi:hypothetical protein
MKPLTSLLEDAGQKVAERLLVRFKLCRGEVPSFVRSVDRQGLDWDVAHSGDLF